MERLHPRRPPTGALVVQLLIGMWLALLVWDFASAMAAAACGERPMPGCYPWSAERSSFLMWHYRDKQTYLHASVAEMAVCVGAILATFVVGNRWSGIAASLIVLIVGTLSTRFLASLL